MGGFKKTYEFDLSEYTDLSGTIYKYVDNITYGDVTFYFIPSEDLFYKRIIVYPYYNLIVYSPKYPNWDTDGSLDIKQINYIPA